MIEQLSAEGMKLLNIRISSGLLLRQIYYFIDGVHDIRWIVSIRVISDADAVIEQEVILLVVFIRDLLYEPSKLITGPFAAGLRVFVHDFWDDLE